MDEITRIFNEMEGICKEKDKIIFDLIKERDLYKELLDKTYEETKRLKEIIQEAMKEVGGLKIQNDR